MAWRILVLMFAMVGSVMAQPNPAAKSVLVIDVDTGSVLFEKGLEDVRPIASITKLMNAVVTVSAGLPLDEPITITHDDVNATMLRRKPTGTSLAVGSTLTRGELLHLALMNSQNRAAAALARTYPGGTVAFVDAMNAKAVQLEMLHTTFTDPTGLINTNVSTAQDLSRLVAAAANEPVIRDFSTSTSFQTTQYVKNKQRVVGFHSTNRLTKDSNWNLIVQKTGYINDAGRCMVVMAMIGARRVVMVLLDTPSNNARIHDAISLRYWIENNAIMPEPPVQIVKKRKRSKHRG